MGQLTKQFGKIKVSIPIPHLLNLQVDSYKAFLQEGRKERLPDEGLEGVFRSVFPIEDFNRTASLEYLSYDISEPKYDQAECISKGLTYEAPIRLKVRLDIYDVDETTGNRTFRDGKEQDIYFGTLPLMTEKGTFYSTSFSEFIQNDNVSFFIAASSNFCSSSCFCLSLYPTSILSRGLISVVTKKLSTRVLLYSSAIFAYHPFCPDFFYFQYIRIPQSYVPKLF